MKMDKSQKDDPADHKINDSGKNAGTVSVISVVKAKPISCCLNVH